MRYKTETHGYRQQYGGYQGEGGWWVVDGKGGQIYGNGSGFGFGWWTHRQYADHVSQKCRLETYIISLSNVTPINLIKIKEQRKEKNPTQRYCLTVLEDISVK